jgi:hypothetical protein
MSLEEIREELAIKPQEQQEHLAAYLTHLRHLRGPLFREYLGRRIDNRDPAVWISLDQVREHRKENEND